MRAGRLMILGLSALLVCSQAQAASLWNPFRKHKKEKTETAPAPKKSKYEKFLSKKGLESAGEGLKIYKDGKDVLLAIPDSLFGRNVMLTSSVLESSSLYMTPGTDVSPETNTFELAKGDTLVLCMLPKVLIHINGDDGSIREALDGSRRQAVYAALPIKYRSQDSTVTIVNANSLFSLEDEKSIRLYAKYYDSRRIAEQTCKDDLTLVSGVRAFDGSVALERDVTFDVTIETGHKKTISGRYLTSLTVLKETDMPLRKADSRIGTYTFSVTSFGESEGTKPETFCRRWDLRNGKKIKIYVDTLINGNWQKAIKEGIEAWNPAFERIGLGSPIEVAPYPSDSCFHAEDPMTSRVTVSTGRGESILCYMRYSKLTGEILSVNIDIPGNYLDAVRKASSWTISDVDTRFQPYRLNEDAVCDFLRADIMKHFARSLGISKNAAGSYAYSPDQLRDPAFTQSHGITASITDGVMFNYLTRPGDKERGVVTLIDRIGAYDKYAIEWLYRQYPEGADEKKELNKLIEDGYGDPEKLFIASSLIVSDPRGGSDDLGNDLFADYEAKMSHLKFAAENSNEWLIDPTIPEDSYRALYREWLWMEVGKISSILTPLVGGVETHDLREGGDKYTPVDGNIQRKAVKTILAESMDTDWLDSEDSRDLAGMSKPTQGMSNLNSFYLSGLGTRMIPVSLAQSVAGSSYTLDDFLNDLDDYYLSDFKKGKFESCEDMKIGKYIARLAGRSDILKTLYKRATSNKWLTEEDEVSLAPDMAGLPSEYSQMLETTSYRHLLKVREALVSSKTKAKDEMTRNRIDYLVSYIDKHLGKEQ